MPSPAAQTTPASSHTTVTGDVNSSEGAVAMVGTTSFTGQGANISFGESLPMNILKVGANLYRRRQRQTTTMKCFVTDQDWRMASVSNVINAGSAKGIASNALTTRGSTSARYMCSFGIHRSSGI